MSLSHFSGLLFSINIQCIVVDKYIRVERSSRIEKSYTKMFAIKINGVSRSFLKIMANIIGIMGSVTAEFSFLAI